MKEDYTFRKTEFTKAFNYLQRVFRLNLIPLDGVFVAGGALRDMNTGEGIKDIDLYCVNEKVVKEVERVLSKVGTIDRRTPNAITFDIKGIEVPVQLIKIMVGSPKEIVNQFDFVQNSRYTTFSKFAPKKKHNADSHNLILGDKVKTPETLLTRLVKMINKGHCIEKRELIKLLHLVEESVDKHVDDWNLYAKDLGHFYEK